MSLLRDVVDGSREITESAQGEVVDKKRATQVLTDLQSGSRSP